MNKINLFKLLLNLQKDSNKGISLTELLVALVMGSIVLTAAASGFINLLTANKDVESKTVSSAGLARALNFIQEDIKQAKSVTQEARGTLGCVNSSEIDSANCLKITLSDNTIVYYGFKDISSVSTTSGFLKPGLLKKQTYNSTGSTAILTTGQTNPWEDEYTVIADGLISGNESISGTTCSRQDVALTGTTPAITVYGANSSGKGGFRFCLNDDTSTTNRLVRIFLYGYVGKDATPMSVNIVTFARAVTIP